MSKLSRWISRFCWEHPRFGLAGLMKYVVAGTVAVYLLQMFSSYESVSFLALEWTALKNWELWRLVTFIFMPMNGSPVWFAIGMYFYYMIGNALEQRWGTAKFSFYFLSGWLLSVLSLVLGGLIFDYNMYLAGLTYVYLAMFAAFAMLFPDVQFLLFFIIPVKAKWLAIADGVFFAWSILQSLSSGYWAGVVLPLVAVLNFFVFFADEIADYIARQRGRQRHQQSRQTTNFQKAVREQKKQKGYHHKCSVCGRTDTDHPQLQFRYCSRCAGYHCFCEEHIFDHTHYTE